MSKKKKLTIDEVVEIKRYAAQVEGYPKTSGRKLAKQFGVSPDTIQKIIKNERYAEIKIDVTTGEIISDGVTFEPTHFKFPSNLNENNTSKIKPQNEINPHKQKFIENYFNKKIIEIKYQPTTVKYEPNGIKSTRFIGSLWKRYRSLFSYEWDDFISQIMLLLTETVAEFEPVNDFDWEQVNIEDTNENKILHSYINETVKFKILDYTNELTNRIRIKKDNTEHRAKTIYTSLDVLISEEDGATIGDIVSHEANIWNTTNSYTNNHFLNWFERNKTNILTTDQLRYLNVMKYFQRDKHDNSLIPYSQIPDEYKPYSDEASHSMMRRIRKFTNEAYEKENKKVVSIRESQAINEINFWQGLVQLIEISDEYIEEQNKMITEWIYKYQKSRYVDDLFFNLRQVDILELRKKPEILKGSTLYYISQLVMDRVEELKQMEFTSVKFYRKASEYGGLSKKEYRKRNKQRNGKPVDKVEFIMLPSGVVIETNKENIN